MKKCTKHYKGCSCREESIRRVLEFCINIIDNMEGGDVNGLMDYDEIFLNGIGFEAVWADEDYNYIKVIEKK